MNDAANSHRFGFIAICGAANVGKSTLINRIVGEKIAITSRRPQTTRHRIIGVKTLPNVQMAFVDTPGLHQNRKKSINRVINRTALNSIEGVDLLMFMIDYKGWSEQALQAFEQVRQKKTTQNKTSTILLINKVDRLKNKQYLLPLIDAAQKIHDFNEIIPICAKNGHNIDRLLQQVEAMLPIGEACFADNQVTDRGDVFTATEYIREKLFRALGQELPYQLAVEINRMQFKSDGLLLIDALIWVDKEGQKAIVIGKGGAQLKSIGKQARLELERRFSCKVHLTLWVKVRKGWAENMSMLRSLGYNES